MNPDARKYIAIAVVTAVVFCAAYAFVQVRSQAILNERHPTPASAVRAASTPLAMAEGQHLVQVTGCGLCHGRELGGKMLAAAGSPLAAPNLTRITARRSDAELDRAIRSGLRPDGTSEIGMPSHVYAGFTDEETADILGYLRNLKPEGPPTARQPLGFMERVDLAVGFMHPEASRIGKTAPPIDLGPRYASGRHLAAVACGQCHGTDLSSGHGAPGPDLMVRDNYNRTQFHTLMRSGDTPSGHDLSLMSETARDYFSHFTDAEIAAIYDYLDARDARLDAALKAKKKG